jgi:hypothetical protein
MTFLLAFSRVSLGHRGRSGVPLFASGNPGRNPRHQVGGLRTGGGVRVDISHLKIPQKIKTPRAFTALVEERDHMNNAHQTTALEGAVSIFIM